MPSANFLRQHHATSPSHLYLRRNGLAMQVRTVEFCLQRNSGCLPLGRHPHSPQITPKADAGMALPHPVAIDARPSANVPCGLSVSSCPPNNPGILFAVLTSMRLDGIGNNRRLVLPRWNQARLCARLTAHALPYVLSSAAACSFNSHISDVPAATCSP